MTPIQMALAIILIILAAALIIVVLMQKSRSSDASAVMGGNGSDFFDKTKGHRKDSILSKATIALGVLLVVVSIITLAVTIF